jgi:hypothetical protein
MPTVSGTVPPEIAPAPAAVSKVSTNPPAPVAPPAPPTSIPTAPPYADKLSEPKSGRAMQYAVALGILAVAAILSGILMNRDTAKPAAEPDATESATQPAASGQSGSQQTYAPPPSPSAPVRPKPAESAPAPKPAETSADAASSEPLPKPGNEATFQVTTQPAGAEVTFDNNSASPCKSPCSVSLPKGRHSLLARLAGHRDSLRIFEIPRDTGMIIDLVPMSGTLQITSTPPGLVVQVDGKESGKTPVTIKLSAGAHKVVVLKEGQTREFNVQIRDESMSAQHIDWP